MPIEIIFKTLKPKNKEKPYYQKIIYTFKETSSRV